MIMFASSSPLDMYPEKKTCELVEVKPNARMRSLFQVAGMIMSHNGMIDLDEDIYNALTSRTVEENDNTKEEKPATPIYTKLALRRYCFQ